MGYPLYLFPEVTTTYLLYKEFPRMEERFSLSGIPSFTEQSWFLGLPGECTVLQEIDCLELAVHPPQLQYSTVSTYCMHSKDNKPC